MRTEKQKSPPSNPSEEQDVARVAVLIDADNVRSRLRHQIADAARRHGRIVRCLVFGVRPHELWRRDGALPNLELREVTPVAGGKNAADIELASAAIDLLRSDEADRFRIVSGDGDFAEPALRLRAAEKRVVGIRNPTNSAACFRHACDVFEPIGGRRGRSFQPMSRASPGPFAAATVAFAKNGEETTAEPSADDGVSEHSGAVEADANRARFLEMVMNAVEGTGKRWWRLSWLGERLGDIEPGIEYSTYGGATLSALLKSYPDVIELRGRRGPM